MEGEEEEEEEVDEVEQGIHKLHLNLLKILEFNMLFVFAYVFCKEEEEEVEWMQLEEVEVAEVDEGNRWCSERTVSKTFMVMDE